MCSLGGIVQVNPANQIVKDKMPEIVLDTKDSSISEKNCDNEANSYEKCTGNNLDSSETYVYNVCSSSEEDEEDLSNLMKRVSESNSRHFYKIRRDEKVVSDTDIFVKEKSISKLQEVHIDERKVIEILNKLEKDDGPGYKQVYSREFYRYLDVIWPLESYVILSNRIRSTLYKMVKKQFLSSVVDLFYKGKDTVFFHAKLHPNISAESEDCLLKFFRKIPSIYYPDKRAPSLTEKKHDMKKKDVLTISRNLSIKEMKYFKRIEKVGVLCPKVYVFEKFHWAMSFIGEKNKSATLKNTQLKKLEYVSAYKQVIEGMKAIYNKANLVIPNISEDIVIWHKKKCYFINFVEAIEANERNANYYLYAGCEKILNFFQIKNVENLMTAGELYFFITGTNFGDRL